MWGRWVLEESCLYFCILQWWFVETAQWSLKYPVNLSCSLALAEKSVHSEVILELRLANLPILPCFFCLSCNWFRRYCRHLLSYPSVSRAIFVICIWRAEDEELHCICSSLPAGDKGNKDLMQTSIDDSWTVAHMGKMHVSEAWSIIFVYKSIAVSFVLALQFLCWHSHLKSTSYRATVSESYFKLLYAFSFALALRYIWSVLYCSELLRNQVIELQCSDSLRNQILSYCFSTLMLNLIICLTAWYILNK